MRNKPNFFIVGSAKSATTSIYNYLEKHKSVFMSPIKEPNFFSKDIEFNSFRSEYKRDLRHNPTNVVINHSAWIDHDEKYYSLFSKANSEKVIGEGSVSYLFSKLAPLEIYKENKDSKVLIILRNPIDRAYSHYLMNLKLGYASRSFLYEIPESVT